MAFPKCVAWRFRVPAHDAGPRGCARAGDAGASGAGGHDAGDGLVDVLDDVVFNDLVDILDDFNLHRHFNPHLTRHLHVVRR